MVGSLGCWCWPLGALRTESWRRWVERWAFLRLLVHIIELLAHMTGCPEHGNQETCDEPVKQVYQYNKDKNIHGHTKLIQQRQKPC